MCYTFSGDFMKELKEFKDNFLNYPRLSIKEMSNLLENSKKDEFMKAYLHNIYYFVCIIYNKYPDYFISNSVLDLFQLGCISMLKVYNSGIRNYNSFTYRMYSCFYLNTLFSIKNKKTKNIYYLDNVIDFEDYILDKVERDRINNIIDDLVFSLGEDNFNIFKELYDEQLSLREVGKLHNISYETVRLRDKKIKKHILNKIKYKNILNNY